MIAVVLNEEGFEYDIHSLVKAFYPLEEVKVFVKGEKDIVSDSHLPMFEIKRSSREIELLLYECEEKVLCKKTELPKSADKSEIRNCIKQLIYQTLRDYTKQELPWGTLTGIRPTKIAMGLLEEGKPQEEIAAYMQERYYADAEKVQLSVEIARREQEILSGIHYKEGYSLYIGIPFCPTTCLYCSFTSFPIGICLLT